ncbi:hypothetical protein AAF712_007355 [Marasmius tenuissimus]|uniref:Uncharacterized protein n=1 Tax=Marasmius tenuissimus TaxID=585030 RepID=A0ABR2ZXB0_9AGAR
MFIHTTSAERNSGLPEFHVKYAEYDSDGPTNSETDEDVEHDSDSDSEGSSSTREQQQPGDPLPSSNVQALDVAESEFATNLDRGANKRQRIDTGCDPQAEGIASHDHLDQTPEHLRHKNDATSDRRIVDSLGESVRRICPLSPIRPTLRTNLGHEVYQSTDMETFIARPAGRTSLRANQESQILPSTLTNISWADISFGTPPSMAVAPFYPTQPVGLLRMSQPEVEAISYEHVRAESGSAYANQSTYSVGASNPTSTAGNILEDVRWSRMLQSMSFTDANSSLYGPPAFDTDSMVSYPLFSTVQAPACSTSTVGPVNGDAPFIPYHTEGHLVPRQESWAHVPADSSGSSYGQSDTDSMVSYPLVSTVHAPSYSTSTVGPANGDAPFIPYHTEGHLVPRQESWAHVPAASSGPSYGQSGPPVGNGGWNSWGDDAGDQRYE